jgi:hypothetical protein
VFGDSARWLDNGARCYATGVSFPTAWRAVRRFQEMGLVEEVTGRKRGQQFRARGLLAAIELAAGPI